MISKNSKTITNKGDTTEVFCPSSVSAFAGFTAVFSLLNIEVSVEFLCNAATPVLLLLYRTRAGVEQMEETEWKKGSTPSLSQHLKSCLSG